MAIEGDVKDVLDSLVSNRCYPVVAPDNPTRPYIIYQVITNVPNVLLDGPGGLERRRMQIDIWAETYASQKSLEAQVFSAMAAATFSNIPLMAQDSYEPETKLFRSIMEFSIWS
ncbi:MAG: DUF3168 domain-containing protein [Proteobacteria bacterium]|nr:DUF3168 domain-containing protein [Pseudomonadota bacterium]